MGRLTQEFTEAAVTPDPSARLTQEFAEVALTADATARLTQEFAEVAFLPSPTARLTQMFIEVAFAVSTPTGTGIWPQEQLAVMLGVQGQRLRRHRGQM